MFSFPVIPERGIYGGGALSSSKICFLGSPDATLSWFSFHRAGCSLSVSFSGSSSLTLASNVRAPQAQACIPSFLHFLGAGC